MSRFSESAYSHAVFCELHLKYNITDFLIPSTRVEGSIGYDLKAFLDGDFYFMQFKIAHRPKARLQTSMPFAFELKHAQFMKLARLSRQEQHVYYVAPAFDTDIELGTHFSQQNIDEHSGAWPVGEPPLSTLNWPGLDTHYVVYDGAGYSVFSAGPTEPKEMLPLRKVVQGDGLRRKQDESTVAFLRRMQRLLEPDEEKPWLTPSADRLFERDLDSPLSLISQIASEAERLNVHIAWRPRRR